MKAELIIRLMWVSGILCFSIFGMFMFYYEYFGYRKCFWCNKRTWKKKLYHENCWNEAIEMVP